MSGPLVLSADPVAAMNPATKGYADRKVAKTGDTMTGPLVLLTAGYAIAFEPTNTVNLTYVSSSNAILAKYGSMSCAVGRGLAVGYGMVFTGNATLATAAAGNIVFLAGSGSTTITLPPAGSLMAGTGFTFSALGAGNVSIVPAAGDTVDLAPILLRQFDRYHIISDGGSCWREVFRTNSFSTHFATAPVLPSYLAAGLPLSPGAGAKAFATNGRKPSEAVGTGTGVEVFYDGARWICGCSGLPVSA
jgi:hypothetical protein